MTTRDIQFTTGVPTLPLFRAGGNSPLLIDLATSLAYYAHPLTGVIFPLAGGGGGGVTAVTGLSPVDSSGGTTPQISLHGLTGFGTALQVIRTNAAGNALEYADPGGSIEPYTHTLCGGI